MIISQFSNNEVEPLATDMHKSSKAFLWTRKNRQHTFGIDNGIWKDSTFKIVFYISRFLHTLTKQIIKTEFKFIAKREFKLIGDVASDYNYFRYKGFFPKDKPTYIMMKAYTWFLCFLKFHYSWMQQNHKKILLKPDDTIIILWNIYMILIVVVNSFYISLKLSFPEIEDTPIPYKNSLFELLPVYSYFLDIILKFNTCIYFKGSLINDRIKIIKQYWNEGFLIDIGLAIPFFIGQMLHIRILDILIVFKIFQLSGLLALLFNRLELTPQQTVLFDLFKLISFMIIINHFSACIWHIIGQWGEWGNNNSKTWLKTQQLIDQIWYDRYIISFYWSIVTMATIGYGDITPVNLTERIYVIVMTMISSAMFGYTVNSIGSIFQDISKQKYYLKNNMNSLNRYLKDQNVSNHIQIKFRRYFEYLWSKPSQKIIQFVELTPKTLRDEMLVDINSKIIQQIPFFKNFSQSLINKLCLQLEEKHIQTGDHIFIKNKHPTTLYILASGQVQLQVILQQKCHILDIIENSAFIGQLDFFLNRIYQYEAVASKNTKILQINREVLMSLFREFPLDYEIFKQKIEDVIYKNQLDKIDIKCPTCNQHTHFVDKCPYLFGFPNKTKTLYHHRRSIAVDRYRKISTLKHRFIVVESILNYMMKNEDFIHLEGLKYLQQQEHSLNNQQSFGPSSNNVTQQHRPSSTRLFNSGNIIPTGQFWEESPSTLRIQTQNFKQNPYKNTLTQNSFMDLKQIEDEIPQNDFIKKNNDSLKVVNFENQKLQNTTLQIPKLPLKRKSLKLKLDYESEEEEQGKIMGQYEEIFFHFDRVKEFEKYNPEHNITLVLNKFLENKVVFQRQTKKKKSKKQETLLHLLKQAQNNQRH